MCFDDGFALRDGIEDLRDTVRNIVADHIFDENRREGNTDHRRNEVPPGMLIGDQLLLNEPLNEVDKRFEDRRRHGGEHAHEEREQQHQMLLGDMAFTPFDHSIVEGASHVNYQLSQPMPLYLSRSHSSSTSLR